MSTQIPYPAVSFTMDLGKELISNRTAMDQRGKHDVQFDRRSHPNTEISLKAH